MSQLQHLPVNRLKIASEFIHQIPENATSCSVCKTIIQFAHDLGLEVLAEGVETQAQADWLRQAGCEEAQGYRYYRAVPLEGFLALAYASAPNTLYGPCQRKPGRGRLALRTRDISPILKKLFVG